MLYPTALLASLLVASPLAAKIEFTGYFIGGGKTSVALSDTETNASAWLSIGDQFGDYTVEACDIEEETVTLSGPRDTMKVRLKADGKVKEGRFVVTGTFRIGSGPLVKVSAATLIVGVENVMPLDENVILRITPEVMSDGNLRYRNSFERKGPDGKFEAFSAPTVLAKPGQQFAIRVGQYEYSFAPKKT